MDADSRDDPARLNPGDSMMPLLEGPPPSQLQVRAALVVSCCFGCECRCSWCAKARRDAQMSPRQRQQVFGLQVSFDYVAMFLAGLACLLERDFIL